MLLKTSAPRNISHDHRRGTVLVTAIETKAQWIPNETYLRYPWPNWEIDGYRTLTWKQYGDSINKLAFWLDEKMGKATNNETVAYLGPSDWRYAALWPALIKTGRKLLVLDGRVTDEGLSTLLELTKCTTWLSAEDDPKVLPTSLSSNLSCYFVPSMEWFLDAEGHKHYSYQKTWDEAKWDEVLIVHTSGTTGNPKPIYQTNGMQVCYRERELSVKHWPRCMMTDAWYGKAMLSPCPAQWLAGIVSYVNLPVYADTVCVVPPADHTLLAPEIFKKLVHLNTVDGIFCPPHTIAQLYTDIATQQLLKELQFIVYLGAPLDQDIGDDLAQHTKVVSAIGSTETGKQTDFMPYDKKLWYTHDFVPETGCEMVRIEGSGSEANGSDDLYELIIHRPTGGEPNLWQAAFWNPQYKDCAAIESRELYRPIQDADGRTRWIFSARKDDLTKLEWLAKFHATDFEKKIQQHPSVACVFVGGEGKPTPFVIVEPKDDDFVGEKADALLDELYQSLSVNGSNHVEIKVPRETVLVTKPGRPLKRSLKQTLMRREIEKDYTVEIAEAYAQLARVKVE